MPKKIIISFDGTWNSPDDSCDIEDAKSTNVWKLHDAIEARDDDGNEQSKWYDEGVGTKWYNKVRGGVFGCGLSKNIQQGYEKLVTLHEEGDEIFIFGFSRGAYSARSLVGLIRNCGLLKPEHKKLIPGAYSLYRTRDGHADSEHALFFRNEHSRPVKIKFLGVWDTVGSLGVPLKSFDWFNQQYYAFHDTTLSGIVENGCQALAIDEHRESFAPAMWNPKEKPDQRLEQAWFVGAHADVGGGYERCELSDIALEWMANKAADCGLNINTDNLPNVSSQNYLSDYHDSFKEFLGGVYRRISSRHYRDIGETENGNEKLHYTVSDRRKLMSEYKPNNNVGLFVDKNSLPDAESRPSRI